ncbi:testis-specific serine/threonine-protein kinase 3-like [Ptychodera flava]|uniref:testis-specific serine/threonine-protein kinase 3-like n=1 Tax=Ptychodera flava TaxID=63121 RepID=UPI003969C110
MEECIEEANNTAPARQRGNGAKTPNDRDVLRMKGLMVGETLGCGSYSKVKFAIETKTMAKVAVKIIDRRRAPRDFLESFLPRELDIISGVQHENIIETYGHFEHGSKVFIIQEYAENGDLLSYVRRAGSALPERQAKHWIRETTCGLRYLHKQGIAHRDLKCENLLLDFYGAVKISDFGFSRVVGQEELSNTYCGSAAYAAPEILKSQPYRPIPTDIWALGVVTYILSCGEMPFGDDTSSVNNILHRQLNGIQFPLLKRVTPECKDILQAMLTVDPDERITTDGVLQSPWLNAIDDLQGNTTN